MPRFVIAIPFTALAALGAVSALAQDSPPVARQRLPGGPMFMMPTGSGRSLLAIASRSDAQNEMHLELRQRNAINDMSQLKGGPVRIEARVDSSNPGESADDQIKKQFENQYGGIENSLKELLKADQFKRLLELDAQWRGPIALGDSRVAEQARLSPEHRREVSGIVSVYQRERARIIFENSKVESQGEGTDRVAMRVKAPDLSNRLSPVRKLLDPLKRVTEDKIMRVLDSEEKDRWIALQGERFTFRTDDPKGNQFRY